MKPKIQAPTIMKQAAFCLVCASLWQTPVFAATFKDVPTTHWAYASIGSVTDRGFMVGDTTGSFAPNNLIDKFETMKILARATGYNYTNITDSEQAYYNRVYDKNKTLLANYAKSYTKWNTSADREISFLIEKEIITTDDLKQFIVKDAKGTEKLRALSREEVAVFLVKLIGKKDEALSQNNATSLFKDDGTISVGNRQFVRYLKAKGVLTGDASGNFNPNAAVNRASMAMMLEKTLAIVADGTVSALNKTPSNVSNIVNITGVFDKFYPQLNAIQIVTPDDKKKIYKLSTDVSITVDGYVKTASDLKEGMSLTAVVANEDELLDIKTVSLPATTATTTTPAAPATTTATAITTTDAAQNLFVEGIVSAVNTDVAALSLSVDVRMLNPRGEIISETRKFNPTTTTQMTRGNSSITLGDIQKGDVVRVDYNGNTATKVAVEEKERAFKGVTLFEKKYVDATATPILVLQDTAGKNYDLRVAPETELTRRGVSNITWKDLRVGDTIDATAEYDKILTLSATGSYKEITGVVQEIHLTKNFSSVVFLNETTKKSETYGLINTLFDVYSLRIGDKVRLRLDSKEVEAVFMLTEAGVNSGTNYIRSVATNTLHVSEGENGATKEVKFDVSTIVTNASNGSRVNPNTLTPGLKIYIVYPSPTSNVAQSISILTP